MTTAMAGWIPQLPELESLVWRMVESDEEDTDVRRAAIEGLLPSMQCHQEWQLVLERRFRAEQDSSMHFAHFMIPVLGALAFIDQSTQQLLQELLDNNSVPYERLMLIDGLLCSRQDNPALISELFVRLTDDSPWVVMRAFNLLVPIISERDLTRPEVWACFCIHLS